MSLRCSAHRHLHLMPPICINHHASPRRAAPRRLTTNIPVSYLYPQVPLTTLCCPNSATLTSRLCVQHTALPVPPLTYVWTAILELLTLHSVMVITPDLSRTTGKIFSI